MRNRVMAGVAILAAWLSAAPAVVRDASGAEPAAVKDVAQPAALPYPVSCINGVVLDAKTKAPVAGARVAIFPEARTVILPLPGEPLLTDRPSATTDAQGRFVIRFMTPSRERLQPMVAVMSDNLLAVQENVGVYQGESVTAEPLMAPTFAKIRVHVVDAAGKPVAGARVRTYSGEETATDKDGCFTETHVPGGGVMWDVAARGYEHARLTWSIDKLKEGEPVIRLKPCKGIPGKVLDAEGAPAADVQVYGAGNPYLNVLPNWRVPVDAQGGFTMDIVPENSQQFYLFPVRGREIVGEPVIVSVGQGQAELRLYPVGSIAVDLKDAQGKPVAHATLFTTARNPDGSDNQPKSRFAETDENGHALFIAPAGPTTVRLASWSTAATKAGYKASDADVIVEPGKTAHGALTLSVIPEKDRPLVLTGQLLDERGQPVLHAQVSAVEKDDLQTPVCYRGGGWTQMDGKFEIALDFDNGERFGRLASEPPLPQKAGGIRIVVNLEGYKDSVLDVTLDWPKGGKSFDAGRCTAKIQPERSFVLKGERAGSAKLQVLLTGCTDENGKAISQRVFGPSSYGLQAAPEETFAVRREGALKFLVRDDLGQTVEVAAPAETKPGMALVAQFPPGRKVELTVRDESGQAIPEVSFIGRPENAPLSFPQETGFTHASNPEGRIDFELARESAGTYCLFKGLEFQPIEGRIAAGAEPFRQAIVMKKADSSISGHVTQDVPKPAHLPEIIPIPAPDSGPAAGLNGNPAPNASCTLEVQTAWYSTAVTVTLDKDGGFAMAVPSGIKVRLRAQLSTDGVRMAGSSDLVELSPGRNAKLNVLLGPHQGQN